MTQTTMPQTTPRTTGATTPRTTTPRTTTPRSAGHDVRPHAQPHVSPRLRGHGHDPGHGHAPARPAGLRHRVPAPRRTLPPHTAFAERLLAVLSGERPVHAMLGHTVGEAYDQLVALAPRTPLRSLAHRPVLRRCAAQPHADGTALEVFASIATGPRIRALAFRLELGPAGRWRCAAVELDV